VAAETATEAPVEALLETPTEVREEPASPVAASPEPKAPAKKAAKAASKGKGEGAKKGAKDEKKGKGKKADADPDDGADGPNIAAHPRAARAVARAKGWGGLVGFALAGYMSLPTNTLAAAGMRALIAGVVCYVATWAGAVFVWRRLVMLEIKGREQQLLGGAHSAGSRRALEPGSAERPRSKAAS
jgi:hypothetical protein